MTEKPERPTLEMARQLARGARTPEEISRALAMARAAARADAVDASVEVLRERLDASRKRGTT